MKLIVLSKGRKAVPIGTRRPVKGSKTYFVEKTATGWKHVKVQRKSVFDNDSEEIDKSDIENYELASMKHETEPPVFLLTKEKFIESTKAMYLSSLSNNTISAITNNLPNPVLEMVQAYGINSLDELVDFIQHGDTEKIKSLTKMLSEKTDEYYNEYKRVSELNRDKLDIRIASNLHDQFYYTHSMLIQRLRFNPFTNNNYNSAYFESVSDFALFKDRFTVTFKSKDGYYYGDTWQFSYKDADTIANYHMQGSTRTKFKRALYASAGYNEWKMQHTNNPLIKKFKDVTGLDVKASGLDFVDVGMNKLKSVSELKKKYGDAKITKKLENQFYKEVLDIFTKLSSILNMKNYIPADGKKLSIKLRPSFKDTNLNIAGSYDENTTTLEINQNYKGAITHEIGHYFWERSKSLQSDFMDWVTNSGLEDKINKSTFDLRDDKEQWFNYMDSVYRDSLTKLSDIVSTDEETLIEKGFSKSDIDIAVSGIQMYMGALLAKAKVDSSYYDYEKQNNRGMIDYSKIGTDFERIKFQGTIIKNATDEQLAVIASNIVSTAPEYANENPIHVLDCLKQSRSLLYFASKQTYLHTGYSISNTLDNLYNNAMSGGANIATLQRDYYKRPTEIFARTFRNYIAYKSTGRLSFNTDEQEYNVYGWGHEEVDPSIEHLIYDNDRLGNILKKHIGVAIMKALTRKLVLLEKGRKAVPIGTRIALPGGKYYREKTATGWKHVKVTRKEKQEDDSKKKKIEYKEENDAYIDKDKMDPKKRKASILAEGVGLEEGSHNNSKNPDDSKAMKKLFKEHSEEYHDAMRQAFIKGWNTGREKHPGSTVIESNDEHETYIMSEIQKYKDKKTVLTVKRISGTEDELSGILKGEIRIVNGKKYISFIDSHTPNDRPISVELSSIMDIRGASENKYKIDAVETEDTESETNENNISDEEEQNLRRKVRSEMERDGLSKEEQGTLQYTKEFKARLEKKRAEYIEKKNKEEGKSKTVLTIGDTDTKTPPTTPDEVKNKISKRVLPGTEVSVEGMKKKATVVQNHRDGTITIQYGKNEKRKRIKANKILSYDASTNDKVIAKSIGEATEATRTIVDAQVNGGELGVATKQEKYDYKPATRSIVSPKGREFTDLPDYTSVDHLKVKLTTIKNALDLESKPSYIPEISDSAFKRQGYRVVATKLDDGNYLMVTSPTDYLTARMERSQGSYAIVPLDVLCATQDYYMKRAKGLAKKLEDENLVNVKKQIADMKDTVESFSKKTPKEIDALDSKQKYVYERAKQLYEYIRDKPGYEERYIKAMTKVKQPRMLKSTSATYEEIGLHNEFINKTEGKAYSDKWTKHREFMNDLNVKMNDMEIQYEEDFSVYHKGEETSYGDKGTKPDLVKDYGVKVKRQNGAEITKPEIAQIKESLDSLFKVYGNKAEMAKKFGLKISHAGTTAMHARKASGIFFPHFRAIGVSYGWHGTLTLAHEWGHFMDHYSGHINGRSYHSDDWNSTAGKMAVALRNSLSGKPSKYMQRTCECFARAMESYVSYKIDGEEKTKLFHEAMGPQAYTKDMEYMKKEVYPLCEQYLKENEEVLKSMKVPIYLLKKSDVDNSLFKETGKYKEGMKKTWTKEQEDEGITIEMEHTDDPNIARQIAMDHLVESANYYKELKTMEKKIEKSKRILIFGKKE